EKARARKFPTKTLRGMVFIWMGEGVPVPIEEDVPPEFFYGKETLVFAEERLWPVNWRVALENALDSHVMYVHRNSFRLLMDPFLQCGQHGNRVRVANAGACVGSPAKPRTTGRDWYPGRKAYWLKYNWRRLWLWLFSLRKHG